MTEAAPLPKPGDMIDGKYRIDHRIGSGAMSIVYQVTHRVTQKRFALKWLLPELAQDADFAKRFLREAQVAARVDHPNVVEVYDVGGPNGTFYMVLELLSGESLHQRIQRMGELTWSDTTRLLVPCMQAIAEAHSHGIIHRDLKPGNIFVCVATKTAPEHAKVLDFGLAKLARMPGEPTLTGTRSGVIMGTPQYMPLEQMRGEPVDRRADVYAFGVTLYQAVTGRLPFQAVTLADLVLAVANESPVPIERWVRSLPEGVTSVVSKAMARDPEDRYPDFNTFLDAISEFVPEGLEAQAPRGVVPVRARKPAPRARAHSSPGCVGAHRSRWLLPVLLVGGMFVSLSVAHHGTGPREVEPTVEPASSATERVEPAASERTPAAEQGGASNERAAAPLEPTPAPDEAAARMHEEPAAPADRAAGPQRGPAPLAPPSGEGSAERPELTGAEATPPSEPPPQRVLTRTEPAPPASQPPPEPAPGPADSRPPSSEPPAQRSGRQWRQPPAFDSHAPPPAPHDDDRPVYDSSPPPMRPTRLPPMRNDEF